MDLPTYTSIWRIEKRLYKLYDFRLPMPVPVGQIAVFAAITVPYVIVLTVLGLPFNHTLFWLYVLPPGVITWLATRPVLESKRLPELFISQVRYLGEPAAWVRMAPLAEKDEIVVVGRVWRRAEVPARGTEPVLDVVPGLEGVLVQDVALAPGAALARDGALGRGGGPARGGERGPGVPPGWGRTPGQRTAAGQPAARETAAQQGVPGVPPRVLSPGRAMPARALPDGAPSPSARPSAVTALGTSNPAAATAAAAGTAPARTSRAVPDWPQPPPGRPVAGAASEPARREPATAGAALASAAAPAVQAPPAVPDVPAAAEEVLAPADGIPAAPLAPLPTAPAAPPAAPPEIAHDDWQRQPHAVIRPAGLVPPGAGFAGPGLDGDPAGPGAGLVSAAEAPALELPSGAAPDEDLLDSDRPADGAPAPADDGTTTPAAVADGAATPAVAGQAGAEAAVTDGPAPTGPPAAGPAPPASWTPPVVVVRGGPGNRPAMVERALSGPGQHRAVSSWREHVRVVPGGHGPGRPDMERRDRSRILLPVDGPRLTVVLGCTVGAGQTVTALMLAEVLASTRDEPVAALDLNPGRSSLTELADTAPAGSTRGLLSGEPLASPGPEGRGRVDVITHEPAMDGRADLSDADYARVAGILTGRYQLTLADPGASGVARLLSAADQLVLVIPASADAARAVAMTMEWLDGHGYAELCTNSITVINGVSKRSMSHVEQAEHVVRGRCRAIVRVPWVDHLGKPQNRPGVRELRPAPVTATGAAARFGQLRPQGQHAYTALAGVLVAALAAAEAPSWKVSP